MTHFQYIESTLEHTYNDWPVVHQNIYKTRVVFRSLGKLLQWYGAERQVSYLLYRAVVQAVLLFGLESWLVSDAMMKEV